MEGFVLRTGLACFENVFVEGISVQVRNGNANRFENDTLFGREMREYFLLFLGFRRGDMYESVFDFTNRD